ncbi:MAG TPA: histidine kinase dimerization/phospho-acceptor domain-containing protein, partial [Candidatus Acidoferrum sp.]|nr:histidine kinase dimerization/phospho-acceptor domain-containing protein [Candidatus Acidoferrum sp.]
MQGLLSFLEDAVAIGFALLGVFTAMTWLRRRERSLAYLALAIIQLAVVTGLGRLQGHLPVDARFLSLVELLAFAGSAFALVLYRNSVIPLPRRWLVAAAVSLTAASVLLLFAALAITNKGVQLAIVITWILVWCACVIEPTVRFWLVARSLPAVQAWRLRSVSLGFGALVAVLLFAISAGLLIRSQVVTVVIEFVILAIIPVLYASFAPPAWLRRQWRTGEEEGVRAFMEQLLVSDDRDALAARALEWAMRLVGGGSAVLFDATGRAYTARGLSEAEVGEVREHMPAFASGLGRINVGGTARNAMSLPVKGLSESGTLIVLAGPFTPTFGQEETTRTQQLMSAFVTALDRRHLIIQLEQSNAALQDANKHKSVFLANMSHELRTPLNAIIGFSELLTDARDGQFDEATRRRFLGQILTSGKHLLTLINDILDLSKVEAGQMELRIESVSIADVVEQVLRTVEPLVTKKGVRLQADAAD